jgi:outer membrane lipoprotein-sorting protein
VVPKRAALLALVLLPLAALAADARAAVERFVARLAAVEVGALAIEQTFTLYHPDGRHPQSSGEQRVFIKVPRRQRVEQVVEGQREVRLAVGDQVWIRGRDGRTWEAPPTEPGRDRTHLLVPFRRNAADVLAEWRALGIRDDVSASVRVGGRDVTVIGAQPGERDRPAVWLDPEHGVVRFITRERLPTGPGLVDLAFSEHRPLVGGFFFPHRQEAFVDGKLVVLIVVRSVRVNPALPDDLFDPDALRRGR